MSTSDFASALSALSQHRVTVSGHKLATMFVADSNRFHHLSLTWDQWLADWSKQRLTTETMALLLALARERNLPAWIDAMFAGEKINLSEARPVLHTALRQQDERPVHVDGRDVIPEIRATQQRMRALATLVRGGARLGATGRP